MKGDKLTDKQRRFVQEYLIDMNSTAACVRAGYKCSPENASKVGPELRAHPAISKAIDAAISMRGTVCNITADRVLRELALLGFSNMRDFADFGPHGVKLKELAAMSEDAARCVAEVSESTSKDGGSIRFKLHDKKGALDSIAKHLGMFKDGEQATVVNVYLK